jgi:integrase
MALKEWRVVNRVPTIKNTPEVLKRFKVYSAKEEEKLLLASNPSYMHDLVILLVDTGMRLGEALAITNKDIDFDRNIIVLGSEITKSEKTRSVPMTRRVREMLVPMAAVSEKVSVFSVKVDAVERAWLKVKKEAGYEDAGGMVLHALRHTYASRLVQAGVELYTVKELLGHSTFKMTERYAHLNPAKLQAAVAVLDHPEPSLR